VHLTSPVLEEIQLVKGNQKYSPQQNATNTNLLWMTVVSSLYS